MELENKHLNVDNLDFLKCYYRPSFFRMKIDLPVKLDSLLDLTDATFALYFHEYIHFIQDISTIYGLVNISTITYYIHESAHGIPKLKNKEFETPISLVSTKDDYGYNNFLLKPYYIGSPINPKHKKIEILCYKREQIQWGGKEHEILDIIKVEANDTETDEKFWFELGGNHITEGMAYSCEHYVYSEILKQQNQSLPADDYPYLVAQKLVEIIYPELAKEPLFVIAACDASLMTYHPGLSFIRLLENLKQTYFINRATDLKQLYIEANNLSKGTHADFDTILEQVKSQIKLNFRADQFEGNNQWIEILFERIKIFRNEIPEFITDFLQFGDLKKNQFFGIFHKLFGSPLVINGDHEGTISLPDSFNADNFHPSLFWAINQMLRVFSDKNPIPCELKSYCIKSKQVDNKIVVDDRCDTAPWTRCSDKDLCPFATMWRHWALCGYEPQSVNV